MVCVALGGDPPAWWPLVVIVAPPLAAHLTVGPPWGLLVLGTCLYAIRGEVAR